MKPVKILLLEILCFSLLSACGGKNTQNANVKSTAKDETGLTEKAICGKAQNEIYGYEKLDSSKTPLVIGVLENDDVTALAKAFGEKYPDIQPVIYYLQKGDAKYSPGKDWIKHGYCPDVVYNIDFGQENEKYLEDLSGRNAVGAYYSDALEANDRNGKLYTLPGPAKVMGIAYNKSLFKQYGWNIPQSFDEFVSLCDRIKTDTNGEVEPYNPNGKYVADFTGGMEAFAYGELFSGVGNRTWYKNVLNGNESFSEHMKPYFDMAQKMIDHGIIKSEHFDYSYTTRSNQFLLGKIAMINVFTDMDFKNNNDYEFDVFPFPALDGTGKYLSTRQSFNLSVIKKARTDAQDKAVDEYLNFISTPEAQEICMGNGFMTSSVKDTKINGIEKYKELKNCIDSGLYFKRLDFDGGKLPDTFSITDDMRSAFMSMAKGEKTEEKALLQMDTDIKNAIANPPKAEAAPVVGKAENEFTVLQASEFIADAFKQKTGADIALVPNNITYRGNIHKIFEGDITKPMISAMTMRSLDNDARLIKVTMTGENIINALNSPLDYSDKTGNCIYAFSGLKAKVAPWNETGKKYLSVALSDGSPVKDDRQYTVAFWKGTVDDRFISETIDTYDKTYAEFLSDAITNLKTISPPDDGRITLVWDK